MPPGLTNGANVIGLIDDQADLVERYTYDPYGRRTVHQSVDPTDGLCLSPGGGPRRYVQEDNP